MLFRLQMLWWRLRTWVLLAWPGVRREWRAAFHHEPSLHSARHYANRPDLGHEWAAFQAMAGFYNDHVRGGFMTAEQARRIYARTR